MKRFFKIVKITLLAFFGIIAALVVAAWLLEDRITKLAVEKVSEAVKAPLGMEGVSFSLIREFPLATVQFKGLWLGAPAASGDSALSHPIDTLARFEKFYLSVESKPLLDNIFNIREVEVKGGYVKYLVNETGATCFDFLLKKDTLASANEQDTLTTATDITLDNLKLKELTCYYRDDKHQAGATAYISGIEGSARIDSVTTSVTAAGNVRLTGCKFGQSYLYRMQQADLQFDLAYNTDTLAIEQMNIKTEGASVDAAGKLVFGEKTEADLSIATPALDLAELMKYIPAEYTEKHQTGDIAGILDLQANIRGTISGDEMPHYEARFDLAGGRVKWKDYPVASDISINGSATNGSAQNNATTAIRINALQLKTNGNKLDLKGSLYNLDRLHYNLKARANLDLAGSRPFIPDTLVQNMKGRLSADIETRGVLPDSINSRFADYLLQTSRASLLFNDVDIDLDSTSFSFRQLAVQLKPKNNEFVLDSFNIEIPKHKLVLTGHSMTAQLDGKISNIDSARVAVVYKGLATPGCSASGTVALKNLNRPTFALHSSLDIDLVEMKRFIPDSLVKSIKGKVTADVRSEGTIDPDSVSKQIKDLLYHHSVFDLALKDVWLDMPDTLLNVEQLTGHAHITPQLIALKNLTGVYSGIDFRFDTTVVKNLFNTVLEDKPGKLEVTGIWSVGALDYGMLGAFTGPDSLDTKTAAENTEGSAHNSAKTNETKRNGWNNDYEIKGKLYVSSLKYKNALIEDISTLLNVNKTIYILDQLKCRAFNGNMNSSIRIETSAGNKMTLEMKNQIDRMDVRRMLRELDNFDQTRMTYENINGILSTDEFFTRIVMIGDSIVYPDMRISGDVTLEKGAVFNYGPVQALAPSIPGVKNLDTLELKTVNSHIFIFKNAIYVPKTYVVSNAFDVSAFGMQSFGEDYQYHLQVDLGIILGKSKKRRKQQEAMGDVVTASNRRLIYLRSFSLDGRDRSGLDNKQDRSLMEIKVRTQEKMLDLIFHPRLVSFDTGVVDGPGAE